MKDIKQHLSNRPDIKELYVNEAGEWLRHPRAGFTKKTRDQILGEPKPEAKKKAEGEPKPEAKK